MLLGALERRSTWIKALVFKLDRKVPKESYRRKGLEVMLPGSFLMSRVELHNKVGIFPPSHLTQISKKWDESQHWLLIE